MLSQKILEKAIAIVDSCNYGHTLLHDELAEMLCEPKNSRTYYCAVQKLNNTCLERGKMLECIYKLGYRVVDPDNYSKQAVKQYKYGANRLKKGMKILNYAPQEKMTPYGHAEYRSVMDKAKLLEAHVAGAVVEINKLQRQQHPLQIGLNN